MKRKIWLNLIMVVGICGCNNPMQHNETSSGKSKNSIQYSFPDVLTLDSANKMLQSYLNSINYETNDTDTRSIIFDANVLRSYLDSMASTSDIAYVKIMFAHKLSYINAGHANQYAGFNSSALTLIITGFDANGNYIFLPDNLVINHGANCPTNCPSGAAGGSLLSVSMRKR